MLRFLFVASLAALLQCWLVYPQSLPRAYIDGTEDGWMVLGEEDFVNVNCDPDTWSWQQGQAHATGTPTCVLRTRDEYQNFELVVEWRHLLLGGNSGVFVWSSPESNQDLPPGRLPSGIEVQILDPGFVDEWVKSGKKADWFTAHGDVFAVGSSEMTPFPPVSPNGTRSFPSRDLVRHSPHWNHYYVRGINGEVRLWVNGVEVSGGTGVTPDKGFLALESEGSPVEFRNLRVRKLP